jgi:hypothetical protein
MGEIAAVIVSEFEVEEAMVRSDLVEFVSDLLERGLLVE